MKNEDEPIIPVIQNSEGKQNYYGLSKREYFVATAMNGILAGNSIEEISRINGISSIEDFVAVWSNNIADKVLNQLEET